ncbi:MAG: autoinducer 2 ABC transporter substrate-binding protein [Planctomycetota bacterium]|jgi:simple sugar transport system substrate-binding protein|nr:autoinducer 2 ABC transporter substrate-binding protein [Planctomycetota bacterium]
MRKLFLFAAVLVVFGATCLQAAEKYTMISVPKIRSPWFNDLEVGILKAKVDFGIKEVYQQAPASADEAQQVRIIEDAISQGVNTIMVVPNDANSCVPTFTRARQQGIAVLTHESPNQPEADYDVEMIDNVKFGEHAIDTLVKDIGSDNAEYVIFVGSLTVPAHNIWADAAIAHAKVKYPNLKLVADRFPVSEDRNAARQQTLELLMTYPNLKGVLAFGSQGAPGAAQALREKNIINNIAVIGTTSPNEAASFLKDGSMNHSVLWSPGEAGRAMVYLAKLILDGERAKIKQGLDIPGLGVPTISGNIILFDRPLTVDGTNYSQYDF